MKYKYLLLPLLLIGCKGKPDKPTVTLKPDTSIRSGGYLTTVLRSDDAQYELERKRNESKEYSSDSGKTRYCPVDVNMPGKLTPGSGNYKRIIIKSIDSGKTWRVVNLPENCGGTCTGYCAVHGGVGNGGYSLGIRTRSHGSGRGYGNNKRTDAPDSIVKGDTVYRVFIPKDRNVPGVLTPGTGNYKGTVLKSVGEHDWCYTELKKQIERSNTQLKTYLMFIVLFSALSFYFGWFYATHKIVKK